MISIVLIGTGNIATHFFDTFLQYDMLNVLQVVGRRNESLHYFSQKTETCLLSDTLKKADVYIIAVSDDAIPEVSSKLKHVTGLVVHTSGSVSINALNTCKNYGVFYPLQTFTKGKKVDFRPIPICIEAENEDNLKTLSFLAETISDKVYQISTEQRSHLHLAAVFVNNFTNYMYTIGNEICDDHKVPFEILEPLIKETSAKILTLKPKEAQTGPARRNDVATMQRHLEQLKTKDKKQIYKLLSESIQKKYGKKL
ncbi:Domain of unknown function DUF2520-containing protein [Cellulophaga algicola DSM 14237]|uniref:DUF2520 domain-containing protein n=1 Tax=Cellulophaga algicola (strain DSM 14237 / IC166 / ACAM 630) TaxID=688270 RepID=E6X6S3_CELAD|nr:DUF2520 domain-containing protein [Cellulophaga algicola]ADV50636.1 Domain of unknown function DUF2520-containing protein [Cellulophaga algicola DSM 14237]